MGIVHEIFPGRMQKRMESAMEQIPLAEEIRIRVQVPPMIRTKEKEYFILENGQVTDPGSWFENERQNSGRTAHGIQRKELEDIVSHICRSSLFAYEEEMKRGYLTIEGGHRVGITGQAVLDGEGGIRTLKNISFLNVRIAHEVKGAANPILKHVYKKERILNTLIISPPGYGKTTLLRDLIRQVSNGNAFGTGKQCCIIDERSELAGSYRGVPQLEVGMRTDVLDGCPKVLGMMMVIRAMSPQVVAIDELGTMEDIQAMFSVIRSGCTIFATIHGEGVQELREKSFLREVLWERVFARYIVIKNKRCIEIYNEDFEIC